MKLLPKQIKNRNFSKWGREKVLLPAIPFVILLVVWEFAAHQFHPDLLPSPVLVGMAIVELIENGVLFVNIRDSLFRVFSGFLIAAILAIPLGLILAWYKKAGDSFSPLIEVLRTISPISWIPLAILWFGIGDLPAIFIIFITSFFPILISTIHAFKQIDPILLRVAKNFGASGLKLFLNVILPSSFPNILIGLRISIGISWVVIVAAEMVGLRSGLGYLIMDARNLLRTDFVMAGMVTIGIIGYMIDKLMRFVVSFFEKHKTKDDRNWSDNEIM